jgi:hypothetical protein
MASRHDVMISAERCVRCIGVVLMLTCMSGLHGHAQNVTEPSLKAAFIYNFAKFTSWPADALPSTGTFTACVAGDNNVFEGLERTVRDHKVWGHAVSVVQVQSESALRPCHLLYLSGLPPARLTMFLTTARGQAILTISDLDDFASSGGIVQMFVENGRMRFDLNFAVAKQARLQISSRLLTLGAHVFYGPRAGVP